MINIGELLASSVSPTRRRIGGIATHQFLMQRVAGLDVENKSIKNIRNNKAESSERDDQELDDEKDAEPISKLALQEKEKEQLKLIENMAHLLDVDRRDKPDLMPKKYRHPPELPPSIRAQSKVSASSYNMYCGGFLRRQTDYDGQLKKLHQG